MAERAVESGEGPADPLARASYGVSEEHLRSMVLDRDQLPPELQGFDVLREGALDNAAMAEHGFPGNTAESFRRAGRVTGYMRELASPVDTPLAPDGTDVVAATVAHLFVDEQAVSVWMEDIFVRQFEEHVGESIGPEQRLVSVDRLQVEGFHDQATGIRAVQSGSTGLLSSTIIDFRIGRAYGRRLRRQPRRPSAAGPRRECRSRTGAPDDPGGARVDTGWSRRAQVHL